MSQAHHEPESMDTIQYCSYQYIFITTVVVTAIVIVIVDVLDIICLLLKKMLGKPWYLVQTAKERYSETV